MVPTPPDPLLLLLPPSEGKREGGDGSVPPELEEKARLAVANCPEYAITIEETSA